MSDRIERELLLPAAPDDVWARMTDPEWLSLWLADEVVLELEVGGEAAFTTDGETRTGWVEEICPPDGDRHGRLAFWWQAADEPATRVELEVGPVDEDRTSIRVTETRPLEVLDLVGIPMRSSGSLGGRYHGPVLVAA